MKRIQLAFALLTSAAAILGCEEGSAGSAPLLAFGRSGAGPGEFNYPRAGVLSPNDWLYVVDKGGRIQALDQSGQFQLAWRMPAIDAGKPTGLGVDREGRIYAADTHYARILVFSPEGQLVRQFGAFGDGPGQFRLPTDVAIDAQGYQYVSEYGGNDRISKFSPDGQFLFAFGREEPMPLQRPQALCLARDQASIWVADACNHRICQFSPAGQLLGSFGALGGDRGQLRYPYSVDCLSDGTLLVAEYGNNRVQRFTPDGRSLGVWGASGRDLGQLAYPWAAVVGAEDRIFVIDSGNNRIQVLAGADPKTWRDP